MSRCGKRKAGRGAGEEGEAKATALSCLPVPYINWSLMTVLQKFCMADRYGSKTFCTRILTCNLLVGSLAKSGLLPYPLPSWSSSLFAVSSRAMSRCQILKIQKFELACTFFTYLAKWGCIGGFISFNREFFNVSESIRVRNFRTYPSVNL